MKKIFLSLFLLAFTMLSDKASAFNYEKKQNPKIKGDIVSKTAFLQAAINAYQNCAGLVAGKYVFDWSRG